MSWLSAMTLMAVLGPSTVDHRASQLCEGGTHLLYPRDGGELPAGEALIFTDRACQVPLGADPGDPIVMVPVADLLVDVDGEPAALVPFEGADIGSLWRLDPQPEAGATVTIASCEADDEDRCGSDDVLTWSFEVVEPQVERPPLVEPVVGELAPLGTTDPFSGEVRTQWTFVVERGEADPGLPMVLDVSMQPDGARAELLWTGPAFSGETVVLGAPEGQDVCVSVEAIDVHGRRAPAVERCASAGGSGSCQIGSGAGAWSLLLVLFGLRRRRTLLRSRP